ncbi:MAG: RluA family pseudouridine synthase [marine benthic group bacterium]|nr:RluA family pseudouridine synthase [Gemmatimonadota bacterium]MCL7962745.1 RluA family pseudouridine synthase [Candidatus Carthagonibacter metallireducens]MCL7964795.1 RluA family pseudouridine synthase [Gemmatimonadota bacterium]MCL7967530.1 RluA family pseudouridine synthase [Gemmatimonadota bacterium]MCL7978971.1 RluA family pseudouridine synthase [Gemmatimonadota bacterium]
MNGSENPRKPEQVWLEVETDVPERLDAWLSERLKLSRSKVASLVSEGRVRIGTDPIRKSYRPRAGDRIAVDLPAPSSITLVAEPIPVPIVFEDEVLVVVDKPSGLVVHPAPGHPSGTLVNALLACTGSLSTVGLPFRPGIVHRLDRDTSGLMVVAKDDSAHRSLAADIAARRVGRGYLAMSWGHLTQERVSVDRPVGRHPRHRKKMAVVESGRRAITHVRRLEQFAAADLLALRLQTGRTHQIRVHLLDLGHPIVGDPVYGSGWERGITGAGGRWASELARRSDRLFLHSARLSFDHPVSGERLSFNSNLPEPLSSALSWARQTGRR